MAGGIHKQWLQGLINSEMLGMFLKEVTECFLWALFDSSKDNTVASYMADMGRVSNSRPIAQQILV